MAICTPLKKCETADERIAWLACHQAWRAVLVEKHWQEKDPVEWVHSVTGHSVWKETHWPWDGPNVPATMTRMGYALA